MQTPDHNILGKILADKYLSDTKEIYRKAFIFGNVYPDINFFTYFRGAVSRKEIKGHHFESCGNYIRRLILNINNKRYLNVFDYFRLGKLIHYTTDIFTFAHNEKFGKNLIAHVIYEKNLHDVFTKNIYDMSKFSSEIYMYVPDLWGKILSLHSNYLENAGDMMWDIKNIVYSVRTVMETVVSSHKISFCKSSKRRSA